MAFPLLRCPGGVVFLDDDEAWIKMLADVMPEHWPVTLHLHPSDCIRKLQQQGSLQEADDWRRRDLARNAVTHGALPVEPAGNQSHPARLVEQRAPGRTHRDRRSFWCACAGRRLANIELSQSLGLDTIECAAATRFGHEPALLGAPFRVPTALCPGPQRSYRQFLQTCGPREPMELSPES